MLFPSFISYKLNDFESFFFFNMAIKMNEADLLLTLHFLFFVVPLFVIDNNLKSWK